MIKGLLLGVIRETQHLLHQVGLAIHACASIANARLAPQNLGSIKGRLWDDLTTLVPLFPLGEYSW